MAERFKCDSNLFFQTSGVQFIRRWDMTLPVGYMSDISENLHVGGLVQVLCCYIRPFTNIRVEFAPHMIDLNHR